MSRYLHVHYMLIGCESHVPTGTTLSDNNNYHDLSIAMMRDPYMLAYNKLIAQLVTSAKMASSVKASSVDRCRPGVSSPNITSDGLYNV